jgi:hypothetical protein
MDHFLDFDGDVAFGHGIRLHHGRIHSRFADTGGRHSLDPADQWPADRLSEAGSHSC